MTDLADAPIDRLAAVDSALEEYRHELTGYCYRMLGSIFDAEDAVQETLVRAWKAKGGYEGRASVRSWIYRIATNVCIDSLNGRNRRALPMDLGPASAPVQESLRPPLPESAWLEPAPDSSILPKAGADPAELAVAKDSVRMAFIAALQHLPPRQRAVLVLREVLRFSAEEVATLLESTVASVNSALQRARATLAALDSDIDTASTPQMDAEHADLLEKYVVAFEAYDIDALVALLAQDAVQSMPPFDLWLDNPQDIITWMLGPGHECRGSVMVPVQANGEPAYAQYRRDPQTPGRFLPFSIHLLETREGRITKITNFLGAPLFARFGLPDHLER